MAHSIESTLRHPYLKSPRKVAGEYSFQLRDIEIEIKIRILQCIGARDVFNFERSHFILTPLQERPTIDTKQSDIYLAGALNSAVSTFTEPYRLAVLSGHKPSAAWLVKNENYLK